MAKSKLKIYRSVLTYYVVVHYSTWSCTKLILTLILTLIIKLLKWKMAHWLLLQ